MKKLIIAGAGGFGRVAAAWADQIPEGKRDWKLFGFIDDNKNALDGFRSEYEIISTITDYKPNMDEVLVCSIGDSKIRLQICRMLAARGAVFTNIIHPTAVFGNDVSVGTGVIICPFALISSNAKVGNFVTVNIGAVIGHDAIVEDGCTIHGHCDVNGNAHLEEGVFMGTQSLVIPGIRIGKYAKIGTGSVVIKNVDENTSVFGNPAKKIG